MEIKVESIYKVFSYYFSTSWLHLRYPEYEIEVRDALYFMTLDDVEEYIRIEGNSYRSFMKDHPDDINYKYAYVVLEIPLGFEIHTDVLGENLSTRIYLPDGTLWGVNTYADFIPSSSQGEEYNFWGHKNIFYGRKPEEIKFKPGDIVEIMGYPGNHYWSNESVSLAIILEVPPTIDEMSKMQKKYLETHSGHDICDHALCREFGHKLDTYKVLSLLDDEIDHAPTISVFRPKLHISKRKRSILLESYEKYRGQNNIK
jgi:hypothetical protein